MRRVVHDTESRAASLEKVVDDAQSCVCTLEGKVTELSAAKLRAESRYEVVCGKSSSSCP